MPKKYLTPLDLVERYGVPLKTVYAWNSDGTGPRFMKLGRHVRYNPDDVEAWERTRYAETGGTAA